MNDKKTFLSQNVGSVISILVYLATFAFFFGNHAKTIEQHSKAIELLTTEVREIKKDFNTMNSSGTYFSKIQNESIHQLELRMNQAEKTSAKIDVLVNDMEWFKKVWLEKSKQ
jgi:hypothetical protein